MLATYRQFRAATIDLIQDHWLQIMALACELERKGDMKRADIEPYLSRIRLTTPDCISPFVGSV